MVQIIVNYISGGTFPVNVYVADKYGNNKTLIGVVDPGPVPPPAKFNTTIPPIFSTAKTVMLILEDVNGCEIFKLLHCPPQTYEICLIFQDGVEFGTQDLPPLFINNDQVCAQQSATTYTVTSGFSTAILACASNDFVENIYSAVQGWQYIISSYYDSEMNNAFYGNNLWYRAKGTNFVLQINNDGYVINKYQCS